MRLAARRMLPLMATVLSVAGLATAPAQAAKLKVTGQETTITANAPATQFLAGHGITASAIAPATLSGGSLTLPIVRGTVSTPSLNGRIFHKGGIKFTKGSHSVSIREIVLVREAHQTVLVARAGGTLMIVARVTKLSKTTSGGVTTVTGDLKLSAAAAHRINHLFGTHVVNAGADFGTLTSKVTVA